MTKQQLLALLREAYNEGKREQSDVDWFINDVVSTNRVGDLELPDINKLKADAVREALQYTPKWTVYGAESQLDAIDEYADKLEMGEL